MRGDNLIEFLRAAYPNEPWPKPSSRPPRLPDWSARLDAYLMLCREEPWAWGRPRGDCCTFALGAVEAVRGVDPFPGLAGSYDSQAGALRRQLGLGGLERATSAILGPPLPEARLAGRGDVVLARFDDGTTRMAVRIDAKLACKGFPAGVAMVRAGAAVRAWRV